LELLESIPGYTYFVFPGSSIKKKVEYDMFARPTIDWDLQCELDGKYRSTDSFNLKFEAPGSDRKAKIFVIVALSIQLSPLMGGKATFAMIQLAVPFTFGFLMRPTIKYREWRDALYKDIASLEELTWFNSCVDEQSQMNSNAVEN